MTTNNLSDRWLEEIPDTWKTVRFKHAFAGTSIKGFPDEPLLAATQERGVVTKNEYGKSTVVAYKGLDKLKLVLPGEFVISLRSFQGGIEQSSTKGIISPAYTVLRSTGGYDLGYLKFLFKSRPLIGLLNLFTTGIRQGRNVDYSRLREASLPFPSAQEQAAIVLFLDKETEFIDSLVVEQQKLIHLLSEKRASLISETVTKGLDPTVKMKDSGVEWIGEVPEHWDVSRIKDVSQVSVSNVDRNVQEGEAPVSICNYVSVYKNDVIEADHTFEAGTCSPEQAEKFTLRDGDVVITKDSETSSDIASPALISAPPDGLVCGYHLAILRHRESLTGSYLLYSLMAEPISSHLRTKSRGVTRHGLKLEAISSSPVLAPPLDEQRRIAHFLDAEVEKIDRLIDSADTLIALLQERRSSLINEVVTGKRRVPEI